MKLVRYGHAGTEKPGLVGEVYEHILSVIRAPIENATPLVTAIGAPIVDH